MSRMATSMRSGSSGGSESVTRTYSKKSYGWWMSRRGIRLSSDNTVLRLADDVVDDLLQIVRLFVDFQLPVRAGAAGDDRPRVVDRLAGAELVDHVVDEGQQLFQQLGVGHLFPPAVVDQLSL